MLQLNYLAFNTRDWDRFLGFLKVDIIHETYQQTRQVGRAAFERNLRNADSSDLERFSEISLTTKSDGTVALAIFTVNWIEPQGSDKICCCRGGAFFEVSGGLVSSVSNRYNLHHIGRVI